VPAETHTQQVPLDRSSVVALVRDRLADILEIDPTEIVETDRFVDDLGIDSLGMIELVESLEDELGERTVGFHIDDEDLEDLETVRDTVDYVLARLG
jgi:acyl carrier protein